MGGAVLLAIGAYASMGLLSWPRLGISMFAFMFGALLLLVACVATSRSDAVTPA